MINLPTMALAACSSQCEQPLVETKERLQFMQYAQRKLRKEVC